MMDGTNNSAKAIQVGIDGTASKSQISLAADLFASGKISSLFNVTGDGAYSPTGTEDAALAKLAKDCAGTSDYSGHKTSTDMLGTLDRVIAKISDRITTLGAAQNRIESAIESIGVQSENITSSLSTLRDADVATESSNYIKAQILQQASATLLATANQSPSIALNLL
jgi:flagellin